MTTPSPAASARPSPSAVALPDRERLQRRSLRVLVTSQVLGGAGLGAGATVGALLAEDMLGATELSGLAVALFTLGSAGAAMLVGGVSERHGRRPGLGVGYLLGALGGAGIVLAAVLDSAALLLPSLLVYGAGAATNLQARYAGSDLAAPDRRGTALSTILVATTLGAVAVTTQLAMVAVMTGTPIHMRDHGHGLGATGWVISLHIAAMFLPSPVTGRLADRYGSRPVIGAGGLFLLVAGVVGAVVPGESMAGLTVALVLLGLGWNLGLLGGTTLLATAVPLEGRARVQGRVDVAVALAGATGGLSSGLVVAAAGYGTLSLVSGVLAIVALAVALRPGAVARQGR
jgi:MFS family permease